MLPARSAFGFSVLVAACWINQLGSSWGYIYICHSLILKNHIMIYYMLSHLCKYLQTCVYIQIISDRYIYIYTHLSPSLSLWFLCNLKMYVDHTHRDFCRVSKARRGGHAWLSASFCSPRETWGDRAPPLYPCGSENRAPPNPTSYHHVP